ncbi:MAG: NUDIX domain-containing protein [Cellvibrionaceae bacterium]|nr:NUDIX domain-containing protein [Cellvibrionaceae bacterium]
MSTEIRGVKADFNRSDSVAPKPSASLLILRDGQQGLEVFMLKRSQALSFSPGFWVFPGGALEAVEQTAHKRELAFKAAAVRETFEESRFLLACDHRQQPISQGQYQAFLAKADWPEGFEDSGVFSQYMDELKLQPNLAGLHYLACWTTPKQALKRFLTRFYIATEPAGQQGMCDGGETVEANWHCVAELIEQIDSGAMQLMFPTEMNCRWLAKYSTVAEVLAVMAEHIAPDITPRIEKREDGIWLNIPAEAGYGITEKFMQPLPK